MCRKIVQEGKILYYYCCIYVATQYCICRSVSIYLATGPCHVFWPWSGIVYATGPNNSAGVVSTSLQSATTTGNLNPVEEKHIGITLIFGIQSSVVVKKCINKTIHAMIADREDC